MDNTDSQPKPAAKKRSSPSQDTHASSGDFGAILMDLGTAISSFGAQVSQIGARLRLNQPPLSSTSGNPIVSVSLSPQKSSASTSPTERKKRAKKDKNAPKRPPSGYLLFCNEHRPGLQAQHPEYTSVQMVKHLAEMWEKHGDKEQYVQRAKLLHQEYETVKAEYDNKLSRASSDSVSSLLPTTASLSAVSAPKLAAAAAVSSPKVPKPTVVESKSASAESMSTVSTAESIALSQQSASSESKKKKKKHHHKHSESSTA